MAAMSPIVRSSPLGLTVLGMLHTQPLHPYGIQRLIRQWGKDQVVNVGQRASLYRTIERLRAAGLVSVAETERDHQYPERTVYKITDAGRAATREWLEEMLAVPRHEFPEFPVALSHVMMLTPKEALALLEHLREGCGTRATSRLVKVDKNTVTRYLRLAGPHAHTLHHELVAFSPADP